MTLKAILKLGLFCVFVTLLVIRPTPEKLTTQLIGDGGDNVQFFYYMYAVKDNLLQGNLPFATRYDLRYPDEFPLWRAADGYFAVALGVLYGFLFTKTLAYNLAVISILFINLFVSGIFFGKLAVLIDKKVSLLKISLAAVLFGASPYVIARLSGHLNLAFVAGFPMLLYAFYSFYTSFSAQKLFSSKDFGYLCSAYLVISLGSLQYSWVITLMFVLSGVYFFVGKRKLFFDLSKFFLRSFGKEGKYYVLILGLCVVLFAAFHGGYISALLAQEGFVRAMAYQGELYINYLLPNNYLGNHWRLINPTSKHIELALAPGIPALILFGYFLFHWPGYKDKWPLALVFAFLHLLLLGVIPIPLYFETGRLVVFMLLFLAYLVIAKLTISRPLVIILILALLGERLFFQVYWYNIKDLTYLAKLRELPQHAVLPLPVSIGNTLYDLVPVVSDKPLVSGYFHSMAESPITRRSIMDTFYPLLCTNEQLGSEVIYTAYAKRTPLNREVSYQQLYTKLKNNDIGYVLYYKEGKKNSMAGPSCQNVVQYWEGFKSWLKESNVGSVEAAYEDTFVVIYKIR